MKTEKVKGTIQKSTGREERKLPVYCVALGKLISPYKIAVINGCCVFTAAVCQAPC